MKSVRKQSHEVSFSLSVLLKENLYKGSFTYIGCIVADNNNSQQEQVAGPVEQKKKGREDEFCSGISAVEYHPKGLGVQLNTIREHGSSTHHSEKTKPNQSNLGIVRENKRNKERK